MPQFTDNQNHRWLFPVDNAGLRRAKQLLGLDVLALPADRLLMELGSPITLIDLLYCLCKPEADRMGLIEEDFGRRAVTDLDEVTLAILEEIANFHQGFARPRQADLIRKAVAQVKKTKTKLDAVSGEIETRIEQGWTAATEELDCLLERWIAGTKSTDSRESSESTPTPPA